MSEELPTDSVVRDAQSERAPLTGSGSHATSPVVCPECDEPAPEYGVRYCLHCRAFLASPHVGRLASVKRRFGAAFIDSFVKEGGLLGTAFGPLLLPSGVAGKLVAVTSTIYWLSSIYMWTKGTTPAKRLLKMTVVTADGEPAGFLRMAFRETIGKVISLMALGMGYLTIPADREKQGWHDKMAGTWVVYDDEM